MASANQVASETIQGIRTVRSFGMEKQVTELYESLVVDDDTRHIRSALTSGIATGVSQGLMFGLYFVAFMYGGWLIGNAGYSGGDVMQTFMAIMMAAFGIAMANMAVPDKAKSSAAADNIFAMLQRASKIDASAAAAGSRPDSELDFDGTVVLKDVNFAYPSAVERPILKNINITIEAGKTTALVGPSGSGKSTIVALLQRFYDPGEGALTVGGGTNITKITLKWWRQQIGFVGQEPVLFNMSIMDNIRYGKPDATEAEVKDAATRAFAHGFITKSCPKGYDTDVSASTLSGGQKQRIAIARALLRQPKLLLLDEATSALDNTSELEVQEAIDKIITEQSMTCVVIAHRLNTIKDADKIIVFQQGTVMDQGTHAELLSHGGLYAELAAH